MSFFSDMKGAIALSCTSTEKLLERHSELEQSMDNAESGSDDEAFEEASAEHNTITRELLSRR